MGDIERMGWYIGGKPWTAFDSLCWKRKDRWLFVIEDVTGGSSSKCLPPSKASRPTLSFKEAEIQHVSEIVYTPVKAEWKAIQIVLYDVKRATHPVFDWIKALYDPKNGKFVAPDNDQSFKKMAYLELYDGCGNKIETWVYENAWPQEVEFGDVEMASGDIVTCQLTLRYDRAYIEEG